MLPHVILCYSNFCYIHIERLKPQGQKHHIKSILSVYCSNMVTKIIVLAKVIVAVNIHCVVVVHIYR